MPILVAAGAAFLFAVVWWDMIFDSQVLRHPAGTLPPDVLATTSSYYRRCTVEGKPMMYLPVVVMPLVLAAITAEIARASVPAWLGWASLVLAACGVGGTAFFAVPRAQRLGRGQDAPDIQSTLARQVFLFHKLSAACWVVVIGLQLYAR